MTVDSICGVAGVSKGSFFHHFESKDDLGQAVVDQFWEDVIARVSAASFQKAIDPLSYFAGYIDHNIETYGDPEIRRGCLLAIYVLELKESNPSIYSSCVSRITEWRENVKNMILSVVENRKPKCQFDVEVWTDFYISTLEGALILAQSSDDAMVVRNALSLYKSLFMNCFE